MIYMVTRESQRGAGCAPGIPINWGSKQARTQGVSAYSDAGILGKPVATKYGYKVYGVNHRSGAIQSRCCIS